jgi:hypothetical protein
LGLQRREPQTGSLERTPLMMIAKPARTTFAGSALGRFALTTMGLLFLWGAVLAGTSDGPGILFLHLLVKENGISLLKVDVRPGFLKPQAREVVPEGIHFDLVATNGKSLWQGMTDDPRLQHVEFEDPPRSGKLKRKTITRKEAEVTVRVPQMPEAERVDFYTLEASAGTNQVTQLVRKSLGSVVLPASSIPGR